VLSREIFLFFPEGGSVSPEEKEGVHKEKVEITAQNTETYINQIIGKVIRMANYTVYPFIAENHIPY
jgi:hypothetical protein